MYKCLARFCGSSKLLVDKALTDCKALFMEKLNILLIICMQVLLPFSHLKASSLANVCAGESCCTTVDSSCGGEIATKDIANASNCCKPAEFSPPKTLCGCSLNTNACECSKASDKQRPFAALPPPIYQLQDIAKIQQIRSFIQNSLARFSLASDLLIKNQRYALFDSLTTQSVRFSCCVWLL